MKFKIEKLQERIKVRYQILLTFGVNFDTLVLFLSFGFFSTNLTELLISWVEDRE